MNQERQAMLDLRRLYGKFGYTQYKMSKFEEYDLYVRNKSFLVSDSVITFTDTNGKLMALKPDVTLSSVKNSKDAPDFVQNDQTAGGGVIEDVGGFDHFYHKGTLTARQIVGSAYAGENTVDQTDHRRFRRNE